MNHSQSTAPCPACGDLDGCHLPAQRFEEHKRAQQISSELRVITDTALFDLHAELRRARAKFPKARQLVPALMEECGELARELLQNGNTSHARKEAIQVACVALRIATERPPEFDSLDAEERQK